MGGSIINCKLNLTGLAHGQKHTELVTIAVLFALHVRHAVNQHFI